MSLRKRTTRRVALLGSSSLVAAGIAVAASLGATLTPTAAAAQATCVATTAVTGNGTSTVTIAGGTNNPGITCTYTGSAVVTALGNIAVSTSGGVPASDLPNGVNLMGTTGEVGWNSTGWTVTGGAQTNGPVIHAQTTTGAIDIATGAVAGGGATVTDGIRAVSTSGGIEILTLGNVDGHNSTTGNAGIWAQTGGAIDITVGDLTLDSPTGQTRGRLYGVYADGGGDVTVDAYKVVEASGAAGVAGIYARTSDADSLLRITLEGRINAANVFDVGRRGAAVAAAGSGIVSQAAGDAEITIGPFAHAEGALAGVDMAIAGGSTTTLNVLNYQGSARFSQDGQIRGRIVVPGVVGGVPTAAIRATGAGSLDATIEGGLYGGLDLGGLTGGAAFTFGSQSVWDAIGLTSIQLSPGDDSIVTLGGGELLPFNESATDPDLGTPMFAIGSVIMLGAQQVPQSGGSTGQLGGPYLPDPVQTIDFGSGDDLIDHAGYLVTGFLYRVGNAADQARLDSHESEVRIEGLETFVNRGVIILGAEMRIDNFESRKMSDYDIYVTDRWHDDLLVMPGTTFKGSAVLDSSGAIARRWNGELAVGEILMDVDLTKTTEGSCTVRDLTTGDLGGGDCLVLDGGATDISEGLIYIRPTEFIPGDRGAINTGGIVLVEMGATGTSAQGHVAVSPNARGYNPRFGGYMDKGLIGYVIAYDEDTRQHKLFGTPSDTARQLPVMAQAAHSLWRTSTGSWFQRQADLRGNQTEGIGGGVWARVSGEQAERDFSDSVVLAGNTMLFDDSLEQSSYAITAGTDVLFGAEGDTAYVVGGMLGYAHSDLEFGLSTNTVRFDGWTGGLYASLLMGGLFLDASLSANNVIMDLDAPTVGLIPEDTILSTRLTSIGVQIEGGWRVPVLAEGVFVEPLAGFSFIRSEFDDIYVPTDDPARQGIRAQFDNPSSVRAGLGARVGIDRDFGPVRAQFSALGRYWNEFEDATAVTLVTPGPDTVVANDFGGGFTEASVGANVFGFDGLLTGFVSLGGRFAEDYQATTATAGVRVNW